MQMPQEDAHIHKKRNWVATIVTLAVLGFLVFFTWRVLYFVDLIRTGQLDDEVVEQIRSFTPSASLATQPVPDGEFSVATIDDPFLGKKDSPLTIVEFADFGCPYSQEVSFTLRSLAAQYPNQIHYIYRDFPITEIHPIAQKAAEAGQCAHEQGHFWAYHDKLYQNQVSLTEGRLYTFANELNLDVDLFTSCLDTNKYEQEVLEDYRDGIDAGVRGTPTFFINGNRVPGAVPKDVFESLIQAVKQGQELRS